MVNNEAVLKENDKKAKPTKINKLKIAGLVSVALCLVGGYLVNSFNKNYMYNGKIANNIFVEGVDISNMSKEDAVVVVNETYKPGKMSLSYENNKFEILPEDIDLKYNINEVVDNAYNYTKTDSYFNNVKRLFTLKKEEQIFTLKNSFDGDKLDEKIEKMSKDINVSVKNASLRVSSGGSFSVSPSTTGKEFDMKANKEAINTAIENRTYGAVSLKVNDIKPKITTEAVKSVNTLLSQHTTTFSTNLAGRVANIKVSSNRMSDVLLMPGDVYSYNKQTGIRTIANGFYNAPVIVNQELVDAPGGGVCQTSTTLYNAVLYSGLKIDQVQNHSLTSSYAPRGKDAMVNDAGSDLKFSNPYDHPVYVKSFVTNGKVTCQIYGNSADKPNVDIIVEPFHMGAKTYRTFKDSSGKKIKTEYIATSKYKK
ncbi:MAG: VanW family protein [Peptostreptococcaceae bacterium]